MTVAQQPGGRQGENEVNAENLVVAVRSALANVGTVREVRMFGAIGFLLNGNLLLGASGRGLLVRVGKDGQRDALSRPGARPMVMRGRTMHGYIRVDPQALDERAVGSWVQLAVGFVKTLPRKVRGSKARRASAKPKSSRR